MSEAGLLRLRAVVELVRHRDEALRVYLLAETALSVWESVEEERVCVKGSVRAR